MHNSFRHFALAGLIACAPLISSTDGIAQADNPKSYIEEAQSDLRVGVPDASETDPAADPIPGQIIMQSKDTILASNLIGQTVYSPEVEPVGDINDVLVKLDGTVEGVVIGVGGFLDIGEKDVAIEMRKMEVARLDSLNLRLVLNATREELEAAPEFKTILEAPLDQDAEGMEQMSQ